MDSGEAPEGIESRSLDTLVPIVASHAIHAIAAAELKTGQKIVVTATYRDNKRQAWYYAQGRTREGKILTRDPGPWGPHALKVALDILPCIKDEHGLHPDWETPNWSVIADCFKAEGFVWGGDWTGFKDRPHFQYTKYQTLAQILAGETVTDHA